MEIDVLWVVFVVMNDGVDSVYIVCGLYIVELLV